MRGRAGVLPLGAALVVAALTAAPPAAADVPQAFELSAVAVVAEVSSTQQPAASIVTAGLVDATAGFASSGLRDGGSAESLAAPVYPGDLVAGGPQLLCQEVLPCPVPPPAYPLAADAAYPTNPDAQSAVLPDTAVSGKASARRLATWAHSTAGALSGLPISWEAGAASTRAWVTADVAHVAASSVLHDLVVGPLRIEQLVSSDLVDVPVAGPVVDRPSIEVVGVSLAGQRASVDDRGVHIAGQTAGQTAQSLARQGISVKLLGTSQQDATGAARSAAGGLEVRLSMPVTGVPTVPGLPGLDRVYVATVLLGGTGIAASASNGGLVATVRSVLAPSTALTSQLSPRLAVRPVAATITPVAPAASASHAIPAPQLLVRVGRALSFDLRAVAAALALGPLTLLLLWRARVSLRRRPV